MLIKKKNPEVYSEGPREINEDNVQFWCRHTKELKNSHVSKAQKFMHYDCVKYVGKAFENHEGFQNLREKYPDAKHVFVCLPLNTEPDHTFLGLTLPKKPYEKDYNNSEYIIFKRSDGTFECNCQGWQSKAKRGEIVEGGANCSHVLSLYFCFKIRRFGRSEGGEERLLQPDLDQIRGDDQ